MEISDGGKRMEYGHSTLSATFHVHPLPVVAGFPCSWQDIIDRVERVQLKSLDRAETEYLPRIKAMTKG
jgi:hypothetical protein